MRYCFIRYPDGKGKALTLSYDDDTTCDKKLIDIANYYGLSVTLNINSDFLNDNSSKLTWDDLHSFLLGGNHEVAIHGAKHIALGKATTLAGIHDVLECRKSIERELDRIIRGLAYADSGIRTLNAGITKSEIKTYLHELGIAYARSLGGDNDRFELPNDFYEWIPTAHHNNPELMNYLDKFIQLDVDKEGYACRNARLFYLWGHAYEFERDSNWALFEDFCKKASGHDDIWYATNIEICDYVNAFLSLIFNVDGTLVFNPTATEVWFDADGKLMSVKPNETVKI